MVDYIDDIGISAKTLEEHLERLEEVLRRLTAHGIHVNLPKCKFLKSSVIFLGHRIDADSIHATDDYVGSHCEGSGSRK